MSVDVKIFNQCDHYTMGKQYAPNLCPKCLGKGYYYDIHFDSAGKATLISGSLKLQQEMLKIINDIQGDNIFFPKWGSLLHDLIGRKMTAMPGTKAKWEVVQCLEYLRTIQLIASNQFENLSNSEILLGVETIDLTNLGLGYEVNCTIKNKQEELLGQTIIL